MNTVKDGNLINKLKDIREELGLTQQQMATEMGLSRSTIANYEDGRQEISRKFIKKLTNKFRVNPEWLESGKGSMFLTITNEKEGSIKMEPPSGEFKIHEMLQKTTAVLESNTIFRAALVSNINAFYQAILDAMTNESLMRQVHDLQQKVGRGTVMLEKMTERLQQVEDEHEAMKKMIVRRKKPGDK